LFHSPVRRAALCAAAVLCFTGPAALAQPKDGLPTPGPVLKANPATAVPAGVRTINWDDLVPKDWDPMKEFKGVDMNAFSDADPRAAAMMKKLREVWDNAPVNPALVGQNVRIPGFAVPLEEGKDGGVKEFLLVPYFGACVHSPPPPANQIIHVLPKAAAKLRSMDAVWITGTLVTVKTDSYMGAASYRVEATSVAPYAEKPR
jgi:hypothetical protein